MLAFACKDTYPSVNISVYLIFGPIFNFITNIFLRLLFDEIVYKAFLLFFNKNFGYELIKLH